MRPEDQSRILIEVQRRVVTAVMEQTEAPRGGSPARIDEVVADTLYHEYRRLRDEKDRRTRKKERAFYDSIKRGMSGASDHAMSRLVERVVKNYAQEISGNFDERVYTAVTRAGVPALGLLLNAISPKMLVSRFPQVPSFDDAIILQGEIEHLRRLHELGTVILVPTHVSNLDSIVVGYALYKLGLPPFIYGAGLNLFQNPLVGYFMHNLGAYTVDRRKRDPLYKQVLKTYATCTLENGYDNIFFPGGTRSRSGAVEQKLKLGLLGTGVRAYVENLKRKKPNPKIFIVPASLSFQLVLEAETLVDDFLKEVGKSRYIITDDEFARPKRVLDFMRQMLTLDSKIYFTVGRATDPFGNLVNNDGESIDPKGRIVDPSAYVMQNGEPVYDDMRDAEYTREVGEALKTTYRNDNLVQATHVTARALFGLLRKNNPGTHIVRLLRAGVSRDEVTLLDLYDETDRLLHQLRGLSGRGGIRLGPIVASGSADDVITDGLRHFHIFHKQPAAQRRGDRVFATDRPLLFYYQNRLEGYRLDRDTGRRAVLTDDHQSIRKGA